MSIIRPISLLLFPSAISSMPLFLSNHGQFAGDRVASQIGGDATKMKSVASLYLLLSGNLAIYYGEEIGMTGVGSDAAICQPMDFATADT